MKNITNIAVVGLGQVGIFLLNELNTKMRQASQAGMFGAINQMVVVLNEYQEEMNRRHQQSLEDGKEKYDELIDVNKK